jgi:hypothetical protein
MDVENISFRIIQEWMIHLNDGIKHLTFCMIRQSHMVHFVDSLISIYSTITQKSFHQTINIQCIVAYDLVVLELEQRFLDHELMDDLGIIYPRYWL